MNGDPECRSIDTLDNVSAVIEDAEADEIQFEIATPRCSIDSNFNSLSLLEDLPQTDVPTIIISETKTISDSSDGKSLPSQDDDTEHMDENEETNSCDEDKMEANGELDSQEHTVNSDRSDSIDGQNVHFEFEHEDNEIKSVEEMKDITLSFDENTTEKKDQANGIQINQSVEFSSAIVEKVEEAVEQKKDDKTEFTDLKNANDVKAVQDIEDEEGINLETILMREKPDDDSDSEFDFELPAPATPTAETKVDIPPKSVPPSVQTSMNSANLPAEQRPGLVSTETQRALDPPGPPSPQSPPTAVTNVASTPPATGPVPGGASTSPTSLSFVKPTPQVLGFKYPTEKKEAEPEKQRVLEAAQEEWDKVTTIQPGTEPAMVPTMPSISPRELTTSLMQQDFTKVKSTIRPAVERRGFAAFINLLFGPPKLDRNLLGERDNVFCIAASPFENENMGHIRTLQTIYRCLTGSKFDCPRMGSHWEEIGFQGSDPATDLRGAGLLGLLNLLYFLSDPKKQTLASDIYRLSLHPTQNFPFCVMGINLTKITIQTLREELLNKECNRRGDIMSVVNEFYAGLYLQLYQVWKGQGKTISDSGYVIKDLELRAKKNSKGVLKNLDEYLNKKVTIVAEKTTDLGMEDFVNVCD